MDQRGLPPIIRRPLGFFLKYTVDIFAGKIAKMSNQSNDLSQIHVIGDRVLVKPRKESERTASGLYLPPGVREKEKIQYGYVVKSGPGYPLPTSVDTDETWKLSAEKLNYMPLQVKEGDLAVFLQNGSYEVDYKGDKYMIVPQSAILMIERDETLMS